MKARLVWLIAILVLGGLLGVLVARDPGYVLVAYDRMAVETSLWFALALLVAGYVIVRLILFLVVRLARGRGAFARWNAERRSRAADRRTLRGLMLLADGRWLEARKQLTRAAPQAGAPTVNLVNAARAADLAGDRAGRDALLREARTLAPADENVIDFAQAMLQHGAGQWAEARPVLERLRAREPAHGAALWLLADCLSALGDWPALAELLPQLRRDRSRPAEVLAALERSVILGRIGATAQSAQEAWSTLSKGQRHTPEYALAYAQAVIGESPQDAERAVREALAHHWDSALVGLYGRIDSGDPARQLAAAESWVKAHPEDPALFLTLGRLCLRSRRWPQAREHFEMSVRLGPAPESQGELGRLYAALGERRALDLLLDALPPLPDLPLPGPELRS